MVGSLVSQSDRVKAGGSRVVPGMSRRGFGVSIALHAAALLVLLLVHDRRTPSGDIAAAVELVMLPAESGRSPAAAHGEAPLPAEQDAVPEHERPPEKTLVPEQPAVPEKTVVPEQPAVPEQPPVAERTPVPEPVKPEQSEAPRPALPQPVPAPPAAVVQEPPRPAPPPASVRAPPAPRRVVARPTLPEHVPEARSRITNAPGPAEPPAATSAAPAGSTSASASAQQVTPTGLDPAWLEGVGAWLLAHRSYPEMARALGRQGTVVVQITVDANGHVEDVNVVRGSGSESLDHAAEALVRNARLPPFPADMKQPRQSVTIPVRYRLE